ncbi:glycosyltransferase family 9 protein [Uliginosibacterium sp. sgz301328]
MATACHPDHALGWFLRGYYLLLRKQAEAIDALERAWRIDPAAHDILPSNLIDAYLRQDRLTEAEHVARWYVAHYPDQSGPLAKLSQVLRQQHRVDEAMAFAQAAKDIAADGPGVHIEYWYGLNNTLRFEEALQYAQQLYAQAPDGRNANVMLGESVARMGNWPPAWYLMQWDYRPECSFSVQLNAHPHSRRHYHWDNPVPDIPQWTGQVLRGKTLCVWLDHGYGDCILVARLLPRIARYVHANGGKLFVLAYRPLAEMLRPLVEHENGIVRDGLSEPADYHLSITTAAGIFQLSNNTLPGTAYLRASEAIATRWRNRIDREQGQRNVAIVWSGGPSHSRDALRSISLNDITPLLALPGITFHSANPASARDVAHLQAQGYAVRDWSAELSGSFEETAGLFCAVDMVVSIDSAPVHLAGAVGAPTVLLLDRVGSHLWGTDDARTPWYDSMQIVRQHVLGQWAEAVERAATIVRNALPDER